VTKVRLKRRRYSTKSDVCAFGATLWEVWTGVMLPYWQLDPDERVAEEVASRGNE